VILVCPILFGVTSVRLLQNLSRGLKDHGFEVAFVSIYASNENIKALEPFGKVYSTYFINLLPKRFVVKEWMFNIVSKKLIKLFYKYESELMDSIGVLVTSGFGGDESLIYLRKRKFFRSIGWYYDNPPGILDLFSQVVRRKMTLLENIASSSIMPLVYKRFWNVQDYDFIIAGTKWVASILSHVVGCEVDGIIYPPVDVNMFKPSPLKKSFLDGKWCLSVGGKDEIRLKDIERLSRKIRVVRSGRDPIIGAINMGYTSDEQLISLYSSAYFTLFPTLFEPIGYIPLESMACGTPVLTYIWQGPGETIIHNKTGWVVYTSEEFFDVGLELWSNGYDPKISENCRRHVIENYSIEVASEKLSKIIKRHY
jgi:glycosyltransferase involved in cell wall biosynthesis